MGAYQSRGPSPRPSCSCSYFQIGSDDGESEQSGDFEYRLIGSIGWACSTPGEYESDYNLSSMGRSLSAQWNGSQLTDSVLSPFSSAWDIDDDNIPLEQEKHPEAN
eukprot:3928166-Amphidinium_carterae.1